MDFFYDGQIRRYVTQFMRVFIGFKYKAGDGSETHVPVMYGDMTRQVAGIIKDNSENKMSTVPRIACYINNLELDTSRLSDSSFVSKMQVRERSYEDVNGERIYSNAQGGGYTVERLMPTPFKLTVKTDIWTSNTDQKLQLLEQIIVLFNPSLEVQTTDNYIDWTSLSVIHLNGITFSSRTIPAGADSEIDICSLEFEMPIYISPPVKVKKLGVIRTIITNMFGEAGGAAELNDLIYNGSAMTQERTTNRRYGIVILKANNGQPNDYEISIVDVGQAVLDENLDLPPEKVGKKLDWTLILNEQGGYRAGISRACFMQATGYEICGTITINPTDPTILICSVDPDTIQSNTTLLSAIQDTIVAAGSFIPGKTYVIESLGLTSQAQWNALAGTVGVVYKPGDTFVAASAGTGTGTAHPVYISVRSDSKGTIDAIINPYNFNPLTTYGSRTAFPAGLRYLMLDDVNTSPRRGDYIRDVGPSDSSRTPYDGPDAWKNLNGSDPIIAANSIIEWNGFEWNAIFNPETSPANTYVTNIRTGIQYKWDGVQWLKSFEGEYAAGYWRFDLDPQ